MTIQLKKGFQVTTLLLATAFLGVAQNGLPGQRGAYSTPAAGQGSMQARDTPPVGAINYIEGEVSLNGQPLSSQSVGSSVVKTSGVIETGQGFVEILLSPGAFLRIGHNSEVRMISAGLVNTQIGLIHGSALIEVAQFVKGTNLGVAMNGVTTQISKNGLYDFDTTQMAVKVLDGKAKVLQSDRPLALAKGDQVLLASATPLKRIDFNHKAAEEDPLYVWSKVRSQSESAANISEARNIANYGGWYGEGWYWNPYWSAYAFLPGYGFAGSPFGWGFYSPAYAFGGYGGFGYRGVYGSPFRGGIVASHSYGALRGGRR